MEEGLFQLIRELVTEYGIVGISGWFAAAYFIWLRERDAKLIRSVVISNTEVITKLTVLFEERMPRGK